MELKSSASDDRIQSKSRVRISWIVLAVVLLGAFAFALWPRSGPESVASHTARLSREFRCVDCEGLSVAESATASARAARADIRSRITDGESDAEIRAIFIDRYGESVLLKPRGDGIGIIVWALPILLVILGGAGLGFAFARWRRQPRLDASAEDESLVAKERDGSNE
jgi:cytochrome c-type biogenesis protein CcmH/NrfF